MTLITWSRYDSKTGCNCMGICREKKILIGWTNVWSTKQRASGQEVDERLPGERLRKRTALRVNWTRRMLWIIVDEVGKGWLMIRMGVSGWMFLLVLDKRPLNGCVCVCVFACVLRVVAFCCWKLLRCFCRHLSACTCVLVHVLHILEWGVKLYSNQPMHLHLNLHFCVLIWWSIPRETSSLCFSLEQQRELLCSIFCRAAADSWCWLCR